jgi:alpha-glucuronidase
MKDLICKIAFNSRNSRMMNYIDASAKYLQKALIGIVCLMFISQICKAEDGHELWLRNRHVRKVNVTSTRTSDVLEIAKKELKAGWAGAENANIILTIKNDKSLKDDGFKLEGKHITANTDLGILYGAFELLRVQHNGASEQNFTSIPSYQRRILNHWDNLDGSVERGYAGRSIFWRNEKDSLNVTERDRFLWQQYARANASIGINGTVLNNVNASPKILTAGYLKKAQQIALVLRPYGLRVYLSVNFSSPAIIGGLKTSDPLDADVRKWWKEKAKEIYKLIPDFGGFLVKANSEGQPGPQDFKRTHVDGANMMADAVAPFGGIIMWRAFVYSPSEQDRAKQAFTEFVPFDGKFRENVIIQVKNGPLDFQPREPFSPLFGAMKKTQVMPEFQITQEYLGQSKQLVYLSPMWEECLKSETYQQGAGSTIAACTDGSLYRSKYTAIAGVANIGLDTNWCGHHFAQANWYAFGRLSWNNKLRSEDIADEWLKQTFLNGDEKETKHVGGEKSFQEVTLITLLRALMMKSREAAVDYMMPLGLHHIFAEGHHYGPAPWFANKKMRPDWTSVYYHQADTLGIGFDRSRSGSAAVNQYQEPLSSELNNVETCPEKYLLWFHHLPWDYKMKSGRILWDELCYHYDAGVKQVREFQRTWDKLQTEIDPERFSAVQSKLSRQNQDAQIWKDACLLYFQQFSRRPIPFEMERPVHDLKDLQNMRLSVRD